MVVDIDKTKQSGEFARAINTLEEKIIALETRIAELEAETGLTSSSYFVCNNDATYDATNSKVLTIVNGKITSIT